MQFCKEQPMSSSTFNHGQCQDHRKGVSYPFSEISMKILEDLIKESNREIFQEKNDKDEEKY